MELVFHFSQRIYVRLRDDLRDAPPEYLLYSAFPGDIEVRNGPASLRSDFGWVPLLNLILELPRVMRDVKTRGHGEYQFTESDGRLLFSSVEGRSTVRTTWSSDSIEIGDLELGEEVGKFRKDGVRIALLRSPELIGNPYFQQTFLNTPDVL